MSGFSLKELSKRLCNTKPRSAWPNLTALLFGGSYSFSFPLIPQGSCWSWQFRMGQQQSVSLATPGKRVHPPSQWLFNSEWPSFGAQRCPAHGFPLLVKGQPHISAKPDCRLTAGSGDHRFGAQGEGSWPPLGTRPHGWWPSPPQTRGAAPRLNEISVVSLGLRP